MNEKTSSFEKQIVDSIQSDTFLKTINQIYQDNYDEKEAVGQEVAALHNAGKIDAIAEFRKLNRSDQQHDFFMIRRVLEKALSLIDAPVAAVMDCVKHLVNDMAAGTLISPFIAFCEAKTERPDKVLSAALTDVDDTFDFITPAITAGSNLQLEQYADKAVELCSHENILIRSRAVHALGRIKYHNRSDLIIKSLQAIQTVIEQNCDEYLYVAALRSTFELFKADSNEKEFAVKLTQHILQKPTDRVLYEASQLLFFNAQVLPASMVDLLLQALVKTNPVKTNPEHHGTIRDIDLGLCSLLERGMQEKVISFLEEILIRENQEFSMRQFNGLTRELVENKERSLDILLTRWLLSTQVLGRAAADLLEDSPDDGIAVAVDLDQLQELPEGVRVFLARKACGWFFHKQISATSFIVSLIDTASDDEIEEITEILFHPLLISYSGSVKDYLVKIVKEEPSEKVKREISTLLERLDGYHESAELPIDELVPTQAQREIHLRYMNRLMAESYKAARKDSFFLSIATNSCLLYGARAIHCVENELVSQKNRQEIPMQEMRHYIEFPALVYLDPHGLDYKLRTFRVEGCDS